MSTSKGEIRFRSTDRIGLAAAEEDAQYLRECFVDTKNYLDIVTDTSDKRCIVLGRTGSGKTALLWKVEEVEERVIRINPSDLALHYIHNSGIIRFLEETGVNLIVFFKLLWRHIMAVEIIRKKFDLYTVADGQSFWDRITSFFKDKDDQKAIEYLRDYGESFWKETDERVREITENMSNTLSAGLSAEFPGISKSDFKAGTNIDKQVLSEVTSRAQQIINDVQAQELSKIFDVIDRLLDDPQKSFFIIIDRLDEDWIEDEIRFKLIKTLLDTVREFSRNVSHAKILVSLRIDLIRKVFNETASSGHQEEKFYSLYIPIEWNHDDLKRVIDRRINYHFESRYTTQDVTHADVLPNQVKSEDTIAYMLKRTLNRPRDIILFVNACIQRLNGKKDIDEALVFEAEGIYSRNRLRSLQDEWRTHHPNLEKFALILKQRDAQFTVGNLDTQYIEDEALKVVADQSFEIESCPKSSLSAMAYQLFDSNSNTSKDDFKVYLLYTFYVVGLVGVKPLYRETPMWASSENPGLSKAELTDDMEVRIHPMFWRVLGIRDY